MENTEKLIEITPNLGDPTMVPFTISKAAIAIFCSGCDRISNVSNVCDLVKENDQGRYAARQWCGWAAVDGKRGQMTNEGFIQTA